MARREAAGLTDAKLAEYISFYERAEGKKSGTFVVQALAVYIEEQARRATEHDKRKPEPAGGNQSNTVAKAAQPPVATKRKASAYHQGTLYAGNPRKVGHTHDNNQPTAAALRIRRAMTECITHLDAIFKAKMPGTTGTSKSPASPTRGGQAKSTVGIDAPIITADGEVGGAVDLNDPSLTEADRAEIRQARAVRMAVENRFNNSGPRSARPSQTRR